MMAWLDGWKTKAGVGAGVVAAIAALAGVNFTQEQIAAIVLLVNSAIGYGLAKKGERVEKKIEAVSSQTAVVANEVRKVVTKVPVSAGKPSLVWPNR